jgi:hypothetical protein
MRNSQKKQYFEFIVTKMLFHLRNQNYSKINHYQKELFWILKKDARPHNVRVEFKQADDVQKVKALLKTVNISNQTEIERLENEMPANIASVIIPFLKTMEDKDLAVKQAIHFINQFQSFV